MNLTYQLASIVLDQIVKIGMAMHTRDNKRFVSIVASAKTNEMRRNEKEQD